jgi:hypothetical protein
MAGPQGNALMTAALLLPIACDRGSGDGARGSTTVKLPPARRQQTLAPGFSFKGESKLGPRDESLWSTGAVRRSVQ